jgi:transposase-like protein
MEQSKSRASETPATVPPPVRKSPGYFTPVQAMEAFNANFLDENYCRKWILKQIHGEQPVCPECGSDFDVTRASFWAGKKVQCKCGKWFSALTGTFLAGTQFDLREVFLLALFLWFNMGNQSIAVKLSIDPETVRLWRHKFDEIKRVSI